jgi:hypothetical protein
MTPAGKVIAASPSPRTRIVPRGLQDGAAVRVAGADAAQGGHGAQEVASGPRGADQQHG